MPDQTDEGRGGSNDGGVGAWGRVLAGEVGGAGDRGRASHQLAYRQCEDCERVMAQGAGRDIEVDAATAEMIDCDVQRVTTPHARRRP